MDHRVKIKLEPWEDREFHDAFERVCADLRAAGMDMDAPAAAGAAEAALRRAGYPAARIDYERTAAEAIAHVAHWTVRRDGAA